MARVLNAEIGMQLILPAEMAAPAAAVGKIIMAVILRAVWVLRVRVIMEEREAGLLAVAAAELLKTEVRQAAMAEVVIRVLSPERL